MSNGARLDQMSRRKADWPWSTSIWCVQVAIRLIRRLQSTPSPDATVACPEMQNITNPWGSITRYQGRLVAPEAYLRELLTQLGFNSIAPRLTRHSWARLLHSPDTHFIIAISFPHREKIFLITNEVPNIAPSEPLLS